MLSVFTVKIKFIHVMWSLAAKHILNPFASIERTSTAKVEVRDIGLNISFLT